jgi:ribosomal protein S17E
MMGRIKTKMIKNTAKQLLSDVHLFNEDFTHNKKLLGSLLPSKSVRNKTAGYIARLLRAKQQKSQKPQAIPNE